MNYLFLMDPLETVKIDKDTTFIFMLEAHSRGYKTYYLPNGGISRKNGKLLFHVKRVEARRDVQKPFLEFEKVTLTEDEVACVFIRTDPPFDYQYLTNTWLLDFVKNKIAVINNPTGVRTVNEKIWATQFDALLPPTLVSQNLEQMVLFLKEHQKVVIKPTDGYGGRDIYIIHATDSDYEKIFEQMTSSFSRDVILQRFVEESKIGDKRILLLNGEPLGAVLRVAAQGEHINNFMAGGTANPTEITERDLEIISVLKPKLLELGLYFVGIDVMGEYLVEVNVTSPTCLQEMNQLYNLSLEKKVIDFSEQLIKLDHRP